MKRIMARPILTHGFREAGDFLKCPGHTPIRVCAVAAGCLEVGLKSKTRMPASTLIDVDPLARADLLLEVEATAAAGSHEER